MLDPKANPSLFRSTLAIIIKVRLLWLDTHPLRPHELSEAHFLSNLGRCGLGQGRNLQRVGDDFLSCFRTEPFMKDLFFSRFSLKFQRFVQDEQEENFVSRLHAGKLNIIPW